MPNTEKHHMPKEFIGFQIESEQRVALDELANSMKCDRTTLINEAIEAYLEFHYRQVELITKRLATADVGEESVEHTEVFSKFKQSAPL